jgi:uncharacterized protein YbjT (DUF2867 family)
MNKTLITGATGNIGQEVVQYLGALEDEIETIAAVRNIEKAKSKFSDYPNLSFRKFDFCDQESFNSAFKGIDILFLLRPPHISEVEKYFKPLLHSAKDNGIKKIVFLSVQGAEKSSIIPHNKIEKLIKSFQFEYIFVRPSYFMQNLTTSLLSEIQKSKTITLPSGKAKFNWVDTKNIGEATASLIASFEKYQNSAYEITGNEKRNFSEVAELMTDVIGAKVTYKRINPISFYFKKRKEGVKSGFAVVMTVLHFLPRFQKEPDTTDNFKMLTGKEPTLLQDFIAREKGLFLK